MPEVERVEMQRSTRDLDDTRSRMQQWLGGRLPAGADPVVEALHSPEANGMSSETLLLDAAWTEDGARTSRPLVARLAPETSAVPVFQEYDLGRQFDVMRLAGELTGVPVPKVLWYEPDAAAIGSPFFVMERVTGQVPPDVMPYNFGDSWLYDAAAGDQRTLQDATVAVLAELHGIADPSTTFAFLEPSGEGSYLRRNIDAQRRYYEWALDGPFRSPLLERCFDWLESHWPSDEGEAVLSWGDARIGNVMYRDFRPVAVLDWEMASLAPREVDLAWMVFIHRAFEDIAGSMGLPGMPTFMRPDDVVASYTELTGYAPRDLDFYLMYAAVRWGTVIARTGRRRIHFGEMPTPDDVDDLVTPRQTLEDMSRRP